MVVSGLTNGTSYTFTVTATNAAGTGPASAPSAPDTPSTVPGAPTGVSATPGNGQATVSFALPASDGGSPILQFTATASPGGQSATTGVFSPIVVTGLTAGTSYTFTVTATNFVGTGPPSVPSNAVTPFLPPDRQHGISLTKGCVSPTSIGQPYTCAYTIRNAVDEAQDTLTIHSLVDVVHAAGGDASSGDVLSQLQLTIGPFLPGFSTPPSCTGPGLTGNGTTIPWMGVTQCTLPFGSRINVGAFSHYTVKAADFNLAGHILSDSVNVGWHDLCDDPAQTGNTNCSSDPPDVGAASQTIVNQLPSATTTTIHNAAHQVVLTVPVGTTVHDQVTVSGGQGNPMPTGNVTIDWFANGTCTGNPAATSAQLTLVNGQVDAMSFPQGPLAAGAYGFKAHYLGDPANPVYTPSDGACEPLHVTGATLTVTVHASGVYGTAPNLAGLSAGNPAISYSPAGEAGNVTGTLTCSTSAVNSSPVGFYPISGCSGLAADGFSVVYDYTSSSYEVTKAPLTVTADSKSRLFGQANPPLTATLTGFVLGQTLASSGVGGNAACTTTAMPFSTGGTYPIVCTVGTLTAANYSFGPFVAGTLTVGYSQPPIAGTRSSPLTVLAGQSIRVGPGARINGAVTVQAGGALDIGGATISGSLRSTGAAAVRLCGSSLSNVWVSGTTGLVLIGGDAATGPCAGNVLGGAVSLTGNSGGVEFNSNTVTGALVITGNTGSLPPPDAGPVHVTGNTITGPRNIQP
jgi:hypothetical protein